MTDRELMQMALDALLWVDEEQRIFSQRESIRRLSDRLAQPEHVHAIDISQERVDETAKRKHEWVGLTDEELLELGKKYYNDTADLMLAAEAKLKEKNT
jgi:zona occludens toxin (predicted ATPase)